MLGKLNTLPLKHALGPERKTRTCDNDVLADDRVTQKNHQQKSQKQSKINDTRNWHDYL